ncbi:hypothetical protein A1O3_03860 [Capronia epimyces CBS 606.96]|uniref:Xylanolytic transcriptional activator regulatory domain-containing protein n=1 Tax=Capronia epimyces CBS 606.96 TaxID=1182542 RepID=W9YCF0_9EURO|nr:uncharacterized protein A1O3_03860 [Capronia epimyces CBS 606.96]EXJ86906.1 hypothetical protein A1O3_03860 [Capronia epimyces CBS 606.96]
MASDKPIAPIEIGSFTAPTPQKTEFIGSASGVFFVNTVFRAFAQSASSSKVLQGSNHNSNSNSNPTTGDVQSLEHDPGSVDSRLVDPETPHYQQIESEGAAINISIDSESSARTYGVKGHGLGVAPDQQAARELLVLYLRNWHPLLPFLHGPTLLETIAGLYGDGDGDGDDGPPPPPAAVTTNLRSRLCQVIVCQCVFNIAALDWAGRSLPAESTIGSATQLLSLVGYIASNHDTHSLQTLLAAQLYLVSTMALRSASTVGGTLSRLMFHAGFHRCPARYSQIPSQEGDLRKRIFWSSYVLDRYLSQALGHPLGLQDSDIDVCIPGMQELHTPTRSRGPGARPENQVGTPAHIPSDHPSQAAGSEDSTFPNSLQQAERGFRVGHGVAPPGVNAASQHPNGPEILGHYVLYCRLTGQALELFHKSLQSRAINAENVMELQSSVHAWWNNLPSTLQDEYSGGQVELTSAFTFFFTTMYNQLLLLINRPFLSLPPESLEFRSSLQTCVAASRQIITTLKRQSQWKMLVSWPGMLSVTWMAGLILSFACTLKLYPFSKARREIEVCIQEMRAMSKSWNNARHCSEALGSLLKNLKQQYQKGVGGKLSDSLSSPQSPFAVDATRRYVPLATGDPLLEGDGLNQDQDSESLPKRRRLDPHDGQLDTSSHGPNGNSGTVSSQEPPAVAQSVGATADWMAHETSSILPAVEGAGLDFVTNNNNGLFANLDDFQYLRLPVSGDLYSNNPGAFGNIGWEAMINGAGNLDDWGAWVQQDYRP